MAKPSPVKRTFIIERSMDCRIWSSNRPLGLEMYSSVAGIGYFLGRASGAQGYTGMVRDRGEENWKVSENNRKEKA